MSKNHRKSLCRKSACVTAGERKRSNAASVLPKRLLDKIEHVPISALKPYERNPRRHPKKQLKRLAAGIREYGFVVPLLIDEEGTIIAGHARMAAAENLGLLEVPAIRLSHLNDTQVRALRIADNRVTEMAEWDEALLAVELEYLLEVDFDVEITGFEAPEVDQLLGQEMAPIPANPSDLVPEPDLNAPPVSQEGDLWHLDEHRLLCGDARKSDSYRVLMGDERAQMAMSDPPYNVPIPGHVCGGGATHHPDFIMASGEMSEMEFEAFLRPAIKNMSRFSADGSVHFIFIDWRHVSLLERVCSLVYDTQLNLCVWVKSNGGMGSLYRSQHELVLVYKNGSAPHINNIQLGKFGRNRTNVWFYEGVNTLNPVRRAELSLHPTVKPVALVADAIRDCSKRKGLILDPFAGSGTCLIACEETGRIARAMELDPRYVDVAVRRWETFTGGVARLAETGLSFSEMALLRKGQAPLLPAPDGGATAEEV